MRALRKLLYRLLRLHEWTPHLTGDGWTMRRYDPATDTWQRREPTNDERVDADWMRAIR